MRILATIVVILIGIASAVFPASVNRIEGIGADRAHLTEAMIASRTEQLKKASEFWLMRHPDAEDAAKRCLEKKTWDIIESAARAEGLDPLIPAAIGFVESYCKPDAKSPTGPSGFMQMTTGSAHDMGLVVKTTRTKIGTHKEPVYGPWRGKGKNRKRVVIRQRTVTDYKTTVIDERLDPAKAIPAAIHRLALRVRQLGRLDLAIQEYHDGLGRVLRLLSLATGKALTGKTLPAVAPAVTQMGLTYPKIFFGNSPYFRPNLYNYLEGVRKHADFGPTYSFRVMQAYELLRMYRTSPAKYKAVFDAHRSGFRDGLTPSRMWSWYTPKDVQALKFADLSAIQKAQKDGLLSVLPQPYSRFGLAPRLIGPSSIAEKDRTNQRFYVSAETGTLGCLMYIANELKLLQGKQFAAIEVNSLVRSEDYQGRLGKSNGNAKTVLPTHTMGKAFDLPLLKKSAKYRRDLLFILSDLENTGMLAFIPEGSQDTIHVVPHPQYEQFFRTYYRIMVPQPTR